MNQTKKKAFFSCDHGRNSSDLSFPRARPRRCSTPCCILAHKMNPRKMHGIICDGDALKFYFRNTLNLVGRSKTLMETRTAAPTKKTSARQWIRPRSGVVICGGVTVHPELAAPVEQS